MAKLFSPVQLGLFWYESDGSTKVLADIVRNPLEPLSQSDRELLADFLEGKIKRKPGNQFGSRRRDPTIEEAAEAVMQLRAKAREEGKLYGNSDKLTDIIVDKYLHGNAEQAKKLKFYLRRSKKTSAAEIAALE